MNWLRALNLAAVALSVSACGGGSAAHLHRTHGTLVHVGGPAPGAPVAMPGARLTFTRHGESANVRTDRRGRFTVDVAAGTYTVDVRAHGATPVTVPHIVHIPHAGRLRLVVNIR